MKPLVCATTLVIVALSASATGAQTSKFLEVRTQIHDIEQAAIFYTIEHDTLPDNLSVLVESGFLNKQYRDPWGQDYEYSVEAPDGIADELGFYIWSWGADGKAGGEGANADIGNWQEFPDGEAPWDKD